ncbi:four-carbon acid sugar kinase family protein [Lentibacillus sp. L22]|uniref:four-carbon acid sugar kinase family protein n=1 Tax=Lentibacillus sp. L22 TaxID=3163028 RepID=UPI00346632B2
MEKKIGIIADDLTGANDSGVQLTEKGISTSVFFDLPQHADLLDSGIVIDTNSRALSQKQAFDVTKQAARFLKESGYKHMYKKMDSTLRGHIGTELQAVFEAFPVDFVVIAPAYPQLGRTTVDGVHFVNGTELAATEAANDPKHPVKESFIPKIIENEIGKKVGLLKRADFSKNLSDFRDILNHFKERNIHYLVCDVQTQGDLQKLAAKITTVTSDVIWAGSAGLAEVLPDVLGIAQEKQTEHVDCAEYVMTVCGSLSSITQKQVAYAKAQSKVSGVEIDSIRIFSKDWNSISRQYVNSCLEALEHGNDIVLHVPSDERTRNEVQKKGKALGLTDNQIGEHVSKALAEIILQVTKENDQLTGFMLTGGDTAKDTTRHLGGIGFNLMKQIETGIPLGTLIGTSKTFTVVTKAGAFGGKDSIYYAMQEMKGVSKQ